MTVTGVILRVLTAAALGVDAIVHARLTPGYQSAAPDGLGPGPGHRGRGSGGPVALPAHRYPRGRSLSAMYEPVWFFEKTPTALAETPAVLGNDRPDTSAENPRGPALLQAHAPSRRRNRCGGATQREPPGRTRSHCPCSRAKQSAR